MSSDIDIRVIGQYAHLSRGRHSARLLLDGETRWAPRDERDRLIITTPGRWLLHTTDGFQREGRAALVVAPDGSWELSGQIGRFRVLDLVEAE